MIHDHVRHYVVVGRQRRNIGPGAEARVHFGVVLGIEACVSSVERAVERQQMDPAEQALE